MENQLEIINLKKTYGEQVALADLTITLKNGIYGLLGQNGAGKSTLMNLITDNIKRDSGEILYQGQEILNMGKNFRKLLGYMPQQQGFYEEFSARMFLHYIARMKGIGKAEAARQIKLLLERVNLGEVMDKKLAEFSGGMRQRVLLAQALLGNPQVLLLDEPTAGLDPRERIRIRNLIAELSEQRIILLATHVVGDVECIADDIIFLRRGKMEMFCQPEEFIGNARGHIYEKKCGKKDLMKLSDKYPDGNVVQQQGGLSFRVAGEMCPEDGFCPIRGEIGMEEAYLYYESRKS